MLSSGLLSKRLNIKIYKTVNFQVQYNFQIIFGECLFPFNSESFVRLSVCLSKNVRIKIFRTIIFPSCFVWVRNLVRIGLSRKGEPRFEQDT